MIMMLMESKDFRIEKKIRRNTGLHNNNQHESIVPFSWIYLNKQT